MHAQGHKGHKGHKAHGVWRVLDVLFGDAIFWMVMAVVGVAIGAGLLSITEQDFHATVIILISLIGMQVAK